MHNNGFRVAVVRINGFPGNECVCVCVCVCVCGRARAGVCNGGRLL